MVLLFLGTQENKNMPKKAKKVTRPSSVSHRKRRGDHHRISKHYLKVYWPYVPMLLIVLAGLFLGSPTRAQGPGVLAYATEMSSSALLSATNTQRAANGSSALTINSKLAAAAQAKANDMAARNYWSHNTPDGKEPWYFIDNAGYAYTKAGENLAYGFATSSATVTGWMNSPSHRANMLDGSFSEVGFGFTNSANYNNSGQETIVVAMYGAPQVQAAAKAATPPATQQVAPATTKPSSKPSNTSTTPAPAATQQAAEQQPAANQPTKTTADTAIPANTKPQPLNTSADLSAASGQKITKLQQLTGGKLPWLAAGAMIITTAALFFLTLKHGLAFKRALIHGEQFILHHPLVDITLTAVVMTGYVLSHTTGFIR